MNNRVGVKMMKHLVELNIMIIVSMPLALWLCWSGRVSWWVLLMILLLDSKVLVKDLFK